MPLRPVSDLGLVDLTELATPKAREPATRRAPARTSRRPQSARLNPSNKRSSGASDSGGAKTPRSGTGSRPNRGAQQPKSPRPTAETKRGLSAGRRQRERKAKRELDSGPPKLRGASENVHSHNRDTDFPAAKVGLSVVTGVMGLVGGLLLSRSARHR